MRLRQPTTPSSLYARVIAGPSDEVQPYHLHPMELQYTYQKAEDVLAMDRASSTQDDGELCRFKLPHYTA